MTGQQLAYYYVHFRMSGDDIMETVKENRPDIFDAIKGTDKDISGISFYDNSKQYRAVFKLIYSFIYNFDETISNKK
tara:strand:+ start:15138 stop:15368 length:231 start_codon:yes stop_codon:yes gene_type:complete